MGKHFRKVKSYLIELGYQITQEDEQDEVFIINDEEAGIMELVIGCADTILIMEQYIVDLPQNDVNIYKKLLQKNREIVHGAFVLDETGSKVIFRDTLELDNLDLNELEGSLNSLSLLLSEYSDDLIKFSKN
jgi:hypothetical protein